MFWVKEMFYMFFGVEFIYYGNSEGKINKKIVSFYGVIVCLFVRDFIKF